MYRNIDYLYIRVHMITVRPVSVIFFCVEMLRAYIKSAVRPRVRRRAVP